MSGCALVLVSTWDPELLSAYADHYTGSAGPPPGKKLAWRIFTAGRARGWIVLGEPAYKLAARRRLGLQDGRPLNFTVCCALYRVSARESGEPSAGDILKAWHLAASQDWERRYGWTPLHWETMVDPCAVLSANPGACFKRAGYRVIGETTGRSARRPAGRSRGPRVWSDAEPKAVLYRGPLARL
jgi:hypothetical protein